MKRRTPASFESLLAWACALARFAVCCWRAAHQAVIIDEATTYNQFVSGPWRKIFGRYDANNHILSTLAIKLSVTLGGVRPFTVRLPSLLAGLALTLGVFWLLKRVESPVFRWAGFALFCLHPLLMDFSIAARGYSLSLAFFVWGLHFAWDRRSVLAGVLLGLSIAANLAIVFPVLALIVTMAAFDRKTLLYLVIPAVLVGGGINYPSLRRAHRGDFYAGYPQLHTAVTSFVFTSLHAIPERDGILGNRDVADRIGMFGLPIFALLAGAATLKIRGRRRIPFLIGSITFLGLILARWWFGVNYPADRTCLYFVILGALAWAIGGDALKSRVLQALWLLPAILVTVQFCTQLQTRYFQFWRVEADDEIIARKIQQDCQGRPANSLAVSTTWTHQPALEFYRRSWDIRALKPVRRIEPTPLTGFDFYVASWGDYEPAKHAGLRPVLDDPDIEVIFAEP